MLHGEVRAGVCVVWTPSGGQDGLLAVPSESRHLRVAVFQQ
jgi:hypothetical protein